MYQRQRRLRQRIAEVEVERPHLWRQQQPLVDHRARRERRHVEIAQAGQMPLILQPAHIVQSLLANGEDLPLECVLILHFRTGHDNRLPDHRHRLDHALAEAGGIRGDLAPSQQRLPLGRDVVLEQADGEVPRVGVLRQEAHRHRIAAQRRQRQIVFLGPVAQQFVRHLDQAAGAVAYQWVGTDGAAMIEVDQDLQPASDDVVRLSALDVDDEAHTARVMLVAGIVQSWSRRGSHHRAFECLRVADMAALSD